MLAPPSQARPFASVALAEDALSILFRIEERENVIFY
jgi:hypothetical protein